MLETGFQSHSPADHAHDRLIERLVRRRGVVLQARLSECRRA